MRAFMNVYKATITTATVLPGDDAFAVDVALPALAAGEYYDITVVDNLDESVQTQREIMKVNAVAGMALSSIDRGLEDTSAETWSAGHFVEIRPTAKWFEELDGPEIIQYSETVALSASETLDRAAGGIQHVYMTANTTLDATGIGVGQSAYVCVHGGDTWALSYTGIDDFSGLTAPPTLKARHRLEILNDGVKTVLWDAGGND